MTPTECVRAYLSTRPAIERQIIECVAYQCSLTTHWATVATANALTELAVAGVVEQFNSNPNAYRITASQKMEVVADRERKAQQATTKKLRAQRHPIEKLIEEAQQREAQGRG